MNFDSMPELPSNAQRALIACSLWLHVGFIGVAASAVGLLQLFDGGRTWLPALVLIDLAARWQQRVGPVLGGCCKAPKGPRVPPRVHGTSRLRETLDRTRKSKHCNACDEHYGVFPRSVSLTAGST